MTVKPADLTDEKCGKGDATYVDAAPGVQGHWRCNGCGRTFRKSPNQHIYAARKRVKAASPVRRQSFVATHEITVPGPMSRLVLPVMLDQGDLWQRSEWERHSAFPMWRLVNGSLEFRHGAMPAGATVDAINARKGV